MVERAPRGRARKTWLWSAACVWIASKRPTKQVHHPSRFRTAYEGEDWCALRGKRLCTDVEWNLACEGSQGWQYPTATRGSRIVATTTRRGSLPTGTRLRPIPHRQRSMKPIDSIKPTRRARAANVALKRACSISLATSPSGWCERSRISNNYDHVMKGCYWSKCYGGSEPGCGFVNPAHPGEFSHLRGWFSLLPHSVSG